MGIFTQVGFLKINHMDLQLYNTEMEIFIQECSTRERFGELEQRNSPLGLFIKGNLIMAKNQDMVIF